MFWNSCFQMGDCCSSQKIPRSKWRLPFPLRHLWKALPIARKVHCGQLLLPRTWGTQLAGATEPRSIWLWQLLGALNVAFHRPHHHHHQRNGKCQAERGCGHQILWDGIWRLLFWKDFIRRRKYLVKMSAELKFKMFPPLQAKHLQGNGYTQIIKVFLTDRALGPLISQPTLLFFSGRDNH